MEREYFGSYRSMPEALAEALCENLQLKEIHLNNNNVGEAGSAAFARALALNSSLQVIDLSANSTGDIGAQALADGLRENSSLLKLLLDDNDIGEVGARAIADAISENTTLQHIKLDGNPIPLPLRREILGKAYINFCQAVSRRIAMEEQLHAVPCAMVEDSQPQAACPGCRQHMRNTRLAPCQHVALCGCCTAAALQTDPRCPECGAPIEQVEAPVGGD
eukprot:EG_transcript_20110